MYSYSLELILNWVGTSTCNRDAAKAVYLITVVTGKQEDGSVYCEDNGTRLNVYQVDTIESNSFRFAASCYLFGDTKYKLHWRHLESGDKCGYSLGEKKQVC